MDWGDTLKQAYQAATTKAQQAATALGNGAQAVGQAAKTAGTYVANQAVSAGNYVVQQATAAKDYAVQKGTEAAQYVGDKAQQGYAATKQAAQAVGKGVGNTAGFAGRATSETANAAYNGVAKSFSGTQSPQQTAVVLCPNSLEAKKQRLEERNRLIASGKGSEDPATRTAANRLQQNNQAVELARLSGDAYDQYDDPPKNSPPLGWSKMSDQALEDKGLSPQLLKDSKAVIYQTPPDWPGGPKTVLAFRGTADKEDAIVDYNQAFALETVQYKAAAKLGPDVADALGPNVLVTGHSLGGGKAQAAALEGGLKGEMFNSAGINPETVPGKTASPGQFQQYRTTGDPLTGTQNSAGIQSGALALAGVVGTPLGLAGKGYDAISKGLGGAGLSPDMAQYADMSAKAFPRALKNIWSQGNAMPPAQGTIHTVSAIDNAGHLLPNVGGIDVIKGQHSITSVINGIEAQKSSDVQTLQGNK